MRATSAVAVATTIHVFNRCEQIRPVWLQLQDTACGYAFQSFAWISALLETHGTGNGTRPALVLVTTSSGDPLMLTPLMVRARHGIQILEFIDFGLADYNAPLIDAEFARALDADGFRALWSRILETVGPVDAAVLDKIPARIGQVDNPFLYLGHEPCAMSMQLHISGSFDAYFQARSANLRADTRAKLRRLSRLNPVSFEIIREREKASQVLETMLAQKSRRYRDTGATDHTLNPARRRFYETICAREADGGLVQVSTLMVGEGAGAVAVATHVGMVHRGRFYMLMLASDYGDYARYSPGRLMLCEMIRWSFEQGLEVFDFTVGDESYKVGWTNAEVPLYTHRQSFTIRAGLHESGASLAGNIRRIVRWRAPALFAALRHVRSRLHVRLQARRP
jgi:CelD/BcsL family acetyltransferase involved in cellulose biosynthesis